MAHMASDSLPMTQGNLVHLDAAVHPAVLAVQLEQFNLNMQQMQQHMQDMQKDVKAVRQGMDCLRRSTNHTVCILAQGAFVKFPNAQNITPDEFPDDYTEFVEMTGAHMSALLEAYGIKDVPDKLDARRERVKNFIINGK